MAENFSDKPIEKDQDGIAHILHYALLKANIGGILLCEFQFQMKNLRDRNGKWQK